MQPPPSGGFFVSEPMSEVTAQAGDPAPADPTTNLDAPATPATEEQRPEGDKPEGEQQQTQPETDAQAEQGQPEDEGGEDEGDDRPKPKSRYQRLKDRADRAERRLAELETQGRAPAADDADAIRREVDKRVGAPPKQEDFSDVFAFEREATAYLADRRAVEREVKREAEHAQASRETARREAGADYRESIEAFFKEVPDAREVIAKGGDIPTTPHVEELIIGSTDAARLTYHLCKNPALVRELNALSPIDAARRVGQIEASLARPPQTRTTRAPAPVTSPKGGAAPKPSPESAESMDDYVAARRAQGWRGAGWR
jgi:hypothetical protein